jgi:Ca2+-binding EF-hand superfamily protein
MRMEFHMVSGIGDSQNRVDVFAMWQNLLKKADKDGDGKISKEEFQAAMPQGGTGTGADALFNKIDADGSGFIDESENAAAIGQMHRHKHHGGANPLQVFQDADKDGDGKISKSEFQAALPQGTDSTTAGQVFDSMDTNQDGVVDASEYMAAMQKAGLFTQLFPPQSFSALA